MVVNQILVKLSELGYSEYEGRVYLAVLEKSPVTAYEASKRAGVPSSKIYQVINRLIDKGMVHPVEDEGKTKYLPLPPEEFIDSRQEVMGSIFEGLKQDFAALGEVREISFIWNMNNREEFSLRARRLIREAENSLLISLWGEELELFRDELEGAKQRDISAATVLFGENGESPLLPLFHHPIENTLFAERGGRGFTLVVDSREAMAGTFYADGRVEGAWSRNRGFVTLAEDYIKHDVYIMKIVRRYGKELSRRFGDNYTLLRDVFSDREIEGGNYENLD